MRQFMLGMPDELLEAARIDGASEWRIFWRIVLPLSEPALATLASSVPGLLEQLPVAARRADRARSKYTLPVALATFATGQNKADYGLLMAGAVVLVVPGDRGVPAAPAALHPEHRHDRPQGLKRRSPMTQSRLHPLLAHSPSALRARRAGRRRRRRPRRSTGYAAGHLALVRDDDRPEHRPAVRQRRAPTGARSAYTSPTNIGAYMWSTVAAARPRRSSRKREARVADRSDARHARRRSSATGAAASSTTGTTRTRRRS